VPGWQGWAALTFVVGLVVAILQWLPGQAGLYLETLLFLSLVCITGFLAGVWLRGARTRTQVAAERAVEDARRAAEAKVAEDARRAAEAKAAKVVRGGAKAKAVEAGRRVAKSKAPEGAPSCAATHPGKRPEEMAVPPADLRLIKGIVAKPTRAASQKRTAPRMRAK
jgi:hypothetical protein